MLTLSRFVCCVALAGALAAGCSTTTASIEQSWRAPNVRGALTSVVTLVPTQDGVLSRSAEDELARDLNARGIRAVPGYSVISGDLRGNNAIAMDTIRNAGFDGVVTMRVVGREQKLEYYPTFDTYWGATWGTAIPETIVRVEISAYSLYDNHLVWSALSKSTDPEDVHELINDVAKLAANELDKQGVVARTASR